MPSIAVNGADIHYELRGTGPSVMFVSGAAGDAGHFERVADLLADEFTVLTYHRRGNSRSVRPDGWETTSVAEQADDAAALLSGLGLAPAAVYGNSYGAIFALDLFLRRPGVVRRAVLRAAPEEIAVTGKDSVKLRAGTSWTGSLTAKAALYTGEKTSGTLTGTDQSDFSASRHTNDAVVKHRIHVPEGAAFTRVAITSADHLPGSDIDLYAFDTAGNHVGRWPGIRSDEHVDLPPGDYDVYVVQYQLPTGATSQQYTLWSWEVGPGTPAVTPTVAPATQKVTAGDRTEVTVTWGSAATRGERYVGVVEFGDGSTVVGRTALAVTP
ncbi:alpha/beta fold hydrolase [Streptomyces lincolnensis]|uniref:alpha/beta fold hydrolase n=1 Tax=Streptomyces lincolnensis TaxID=1915 RepID=UPI001E585187|nr:alpha/beta hydrolase [Streptomyces lincolnensis]